MILVKERKLLEFMCMVKREAGTDSFNAEFPPTHAKKGRGSSRKRRNGGYRRGSTSLSDVTTISGGFDGMHYFEMQDGVIRVYPDRDEKEELFPVADATTFFTDLHHLLRVIAAGNIRTLCHHRLNLLEQKFNLHLMLNADREFLAQKSAPHRDFYNVRKVDTHVHHSACMNQKHLLRFIKSKLRKEPDEVIFWILL
ncbi:AMP deaminase [Glycine soja]|uniref:AMP deaminase n=1 Tax=Glycine soja TaxID=3848 RepID=A0A0B2SVG2_GLYSO|nr:AMP deaminase [Glycine soja]